MARHGFFRLLAVPLALAACDLEDPPDGPGSGGRPGVGDRPRPERFDGSVVRAVVPPPALQGGTLLVTSRDLVVAGDPDRSRIWIASLGGGALTLVRELALAEGAEPGRLVEDAAGRVHVSIRQGGLVTLDPASGTVLATRDTCALPRGLAYRAASDELVIACADGTVVALPAAPPGAARVLARLDADLRDVVVRGDYLLLTQLKSADVLRLSPAAPGAATRSSLPSGRDPSRCCDEDGGPARFDARVAWRAVPMPDGGAAIVHQQALVGAVSTEPGGYGSTERGESCGGAIVRSAVTLVDDDGLVPGGAGPATLAFAVLPIDVAVSPDGARVAVVAAGNAFIGAATVLVYHRDLLASLPAESGACAFEEDAGGHGEEAIAVAFTSTGRVVYQTREPAAIHVLHGESLVLSDDGRFDTGHALFHQNAGGQLACASCHPGGQEDGHTWLFDGLGPRRTQMLAGGILGSEPFHWSGDMRDFHQLVDEVFVERMSGFPLHDGEVDALSGWIDSVPAPVAPPPADEAAALRGKVLFDSEAVGCGSCHAGARLSNDLTFDVGTGGALQVPSLVGVWARAPYLHTGCAPTLRDRFDPQCGGGDRHGFTSHLTDAELDDLAAYLETL